MNRKQISLFVIAVLCTSACGADDAATDAGSAGSSAIAGSGAGSSGGTGGMGGAGKGGAGSVAEPDADGGNLDADISDASADTGVDAAPDPLEGDFELPEHPPAHPDVSEQNVPHGESFDFTMDSKDSAIFPGTTSTLDDPKAFTRGVKVYIPKQYVDGTEAPFMVVADARDQGEIRNTVDNLIVKKKIPKLIVIFINNRGDDGMGSERGLEYDTMSDAYSRFVDTEVLPAVLKDAGIKAKYPNLKLTDDPDGRSAYGCSSGGAASLIQGWFTPDKYRKILSYSGTFVDQQDDDAPTEVEFPYGAWEFHSHKELIANNPKKPLRIFIEVGENDNKFNSEHHDWIEANKRTAAALKAKGYHYRFVFVKGAGHCDGEAIRATLPDTFEFIWRGFPTD